MELLPQEALKTFRRLEEFCRDLDQGGTPLEIMKIWRDFVAEMAFEERTGSFIDDTPELDEVLKDISSSAKELGMKVEMLEDMDRDIGPAAKVVLKGQEAVDYICGWAGNATLPIRLPQSGSLTVYAGLPPVLTVHRYWIMTDVDYNTWPGRLRESPLLGNESKAKFNRSVRSEDGEMGAHIPELHEERERRKLSSGGSSRRLSRARSSHVRLRTGTEGLWAFHSSLSRFSGQRIGNAGG